MLRLPSSIVLSLALCAVAQGCSDEPASNADASAVTDVTADASSDLGGDVPPPDAGADVGATDVPRADAGTDLGNTTDVAVTDARTDAAATDGSTDAGAGCALARALVTTTDYASGGYAIGPIASPALMTVGGMAPDQDHVPVESGCVVYNLLRGNDALAVLDPANLPAALRTIPLRSMLTVDAGGSSYQVNPYDVLTLSPTRAYVAQLALSRLAIVDPTRDGAAALTGSVDLAPLRAAADTDPSGSPEAVQLLRVGSRVLVLLQNLSSFAPVADGVLGVIDPATDALVDVDPMTAGTQGVGLGVRNPAAATLTPSGSRVVVAASGAVAFAPPQALDGAIVAVDAATLTLASGRVTEAQLGGDVAGVVMHSDTAGWAVVNTLDADGGAPTARVVAFDLATSTVGATVYTTTNIAGVARAPDGNVWVLDRGATTAGVRVFRPDGTAVTTGALSTGALPPSGVAFVP